MLYSKNMIYPMPDMIILTGNPLNPFDSEGYNI